MTEEQWKQYHAMVGRLPGDLAVVVFEDDNVRSILTNATAAYLVTLGRARLATAEESAEFLAKSRKILGDAIEQSSPRIGKVRSDIENFIFENNRWWISHATTKGSVDDWESSLSPRDKLEAYLHWNGLIGYTDELIEAFRWIFRGEGHGL